MAATSLAHAPVSHEPVFRFSSEENVIRKLRVLLELERRGFKNLLETLDTNYTAQIDGEYAMFCTPARQEHGRRDTTIRRHKDEREAVYAILAASVPPMENLGEYRLHVAWDGAHAAADLIVDSDDRGILTVFTWEGDEESREHFFGETAQVFLPGREGSAFICPFFGCGQLTDTLYRDNYGYAFGCADCLPRAAFENKPVFVATIAMGGAR